MKNEIAVLLPLPFPLTAEWEHHRLVCYGNRWLEHHGIDGGATIATPRGIELIVDAEQMDQLCLDLYSQLEEDDREDYREFMRDITGCRMSALLEFMGAIEWFEDVITGVYK